MFPTLEIIATIGRHGVDRRPAYRNDRCHKQGQAIGLFQKIPIIIQGKRNKGKNSFLSGLCKESEQRNRQQKVFPGHLVGRHKGIPSHQGRKQANVEHLGRSRPGLQQVNRHASQEGRRRQGQWLALKPPGKSQEEEQKAQYVEGIVHQQGGIPVGFHKVENQGIHKA